MPEKEMVCHRYKGEHIPGCWGCSVYGHEYCTCGDRWPNRINALERRIKQLEEKVKRLSREMKCRN